MTDVVPLDQLNISLEPHLIDTLRPVLPIASADLAPILAPYLSSDPPSTIPYAVLRRLSQWARTTGCDALREQSPPLDPQAYTMIALLAGTTTSPERKFGDFTPARDPADVQAERNKERKTITAILNALLSVFGSGFAAWWAADKTGWRNEWVGKTIFSYDLRLVPFMQRTLFGLSVAILVAVAEAGLYFVWQGRRSASKPASRRRRLPLVRDKKNDGDGPDMPATDTPNVEETNEGLRRRH